MGRRRKGRNMTRREQLQERYEDALFALLMDDVATAEGKRAAEENERLKSDPSAGISEGAERRSLQTIRRQFTKQSLRSAGHFTVKTVKRVVMAAGIAAILFTGAFAASETVRLNALNLIIEVFDTNTTFRFVDQPAEMEGPHLEVGWLPEGYKLMNHEENDTFIGYQYQRAEGECIYIDYYLTPGMEANVDTENAKIEYVDIQKTKATLYQKENVIHLVWTTKDNTALTWLMGESVSQDDLLRVANELKY